MPLTTTALWPDLVAGKKAKASEVEAKFDWLEGSLFPHNSGNATNNAYDIGTSTYNFRTGYFGTSVYTPALNPTTTASGVAIGKDTADANTCLDLSAIPKALLMPILTTTQRDALTPAVGMMIYNSTNARMERYEGGQWLAMNNPYGLKAKVSAVNTTIAYTEAVNVSGSGMIKIISAGTSNGTFTCSSYITIDGTGFNTLSTNSVPPTVSSYAFDSGLTSGAFLLFGSSSADSNLKPLDIGFKSSFVAYFKSWSAGTPVYLNIFYEAA